MATSRSLLFQLPRFVSSCLHALRRRASPSTTGLQRMLAAATSHREVAAAHGDGDAIVATSLSWDRQRQADVAAELLAGKRRAPSPKIRPDKPVEGSGKDKHNGVPDKKSEEGKQGTRNNYAASSSG